MSQDIILFLLRAYDALLGNAEFLIEKLSENVISIPVLGISWSFFEVAFGGTFWVYIVYAAVAFVIDIFP